MNEFIGTVKDNYIFTNRLSNIKVGDTLYNYEKIKYHRMAMTPQDKADWYNGYLPKDTPKEEFAKPEEYTFSAFNTSQIYGTGKITSKYRVVEIFNTDMTLDYLVGKISPKQFGKWTHKYAIKLELIEQVDYELREFMSVSRTKKEHWYYKHSLSYKEFLEVLLNSPQDLDQLKDNCKLKRYNSLMKVIHIGDNNA